MANITRITFPTILPTLESPRLFLSQITKNDLEEYYFLCSDETTMRLWGTKTHSNPSETEELISYLQQQFFKQQLIRWGIRLKTDHRLVGDIGFWRFIYPRDRAEIGTKIHHTLWNKGLITEASNLVIKYAFDVMGLHSIEGNVEPSNAPSIHLLQKLGFTQEGYIKEHTYCHYSEQYKDTLLFSLRGGVTHDQ